MKKKMIRVMAAMFGAMLLVSGCTAKDVTYLSEIKDASQYVTLGNYKGLDLDVDKVEVTAEYIEYYVSYVLSQNQIEEEVTDRAIEMGDIAHIDYAGYKDGVAFEGGTGSHDLEIGSGTFIPGFESGLVGAKVGDHVALDLTFPEEYGNADLAGQAVVFEVDINSITTKTIPELTDEFVVNTLQIDGVENVDQYYAYVRELLEADSDSSSRSSLKQKILEQVEADSEFLNVPEKMIAKNYTAIVDRINALAISAGTDLAQYMMYYYGLDQDGYKEEFQTTAEESAKQNLILKAIAEKEGIQVSDEEYMEAITNTAIQNGYEDVEEYIANTDEETYKEYLLGEKVIDFIVSQSNVTYHNIDMLGESIEE